MKILTVILAILVVVAIFVIVGLFIHWTAKERDYEEREEHYETILEEKDHIYANIRREYDNVKYEHEETKRNYEETKRDYEETKKDFTAFADAVHEAEEKEKEIAKRRRVGKNDKLFILERDNYTCQICGISKQFVDNLCPGLGDYLLLEIDHIDSVANGANSNTDNLQTLCWRCNRKKGGKKTNAQVIAIITYGIKYLKTNISQ